jgi:hypothetical protein
LTAFLLKFERRKECWLSPFLFIIAQEVLASIIRKEKINNLKVKLPLFAGDMIMHVDNPKKFIKYS